MRMEMKQTSSIMMGIAQLTVLSVGSASMTTYLPFLCQLLI